MKRRSLLIGMAASMLLAPQAGSAQSVERQITRQLRNSGYSDISARRTLLGRVRITARRGSQTREIIVNPSTGAVLRDFTKDASGRPIWEDTGNRPGRRNGGGDTNSSSGNDDSDDDDNDDNDDGGDDEGDEGDDD